MGISVWRVAGSSSFDHCWISGALNSLMDTRRIRRFRKKLRISTITQNPCSECLSRHLPVACKQMKSHSYAWSLFCSFHDRLCFATHALCKLDHWTLMNKHSVFEMVQHKYTMYTISCPHSQATVSIDQHTWSTVIPKLVTNAQIKRLTSLDSWHKWPQHGTCCDGLYHGKHAWQPKPASPTSSPVSYDSVSNRFCNTSFCFLNSKLRCSVLATASSSATRACKISR